MKYETSRQFCLERFTCCPKERVLKFNPLLGQSDIPIVTGAGMA
jgi:hypothetical protein